MRVKRHHLGNKMNPAIAVLVFILLVGLIPIRTVMAAGLEAKIPYQQNWVNDSNRNPNSTFEYRLTSADGSPLPDESSGGYYSYTASGQASGELTLHFPFSKPGYYNYLVTPNITDRQTGYTYQETSYQVMIMAVNGESGLEIGPITITNPDTGNKPQSLVYTQRYYQRTPGGGGRTPAGGGGTPATAAPGAAAPSEVIPDEPVPESPVEIEDPDTPRIKPDEDYWALLNLILTILTVLIALVDVILYFKRPRSDKEAEENGEVPEDEDWQDRFARRGAMRILALIVAIIAVIVFILTEDMRLPMEWVDEYTIWMVILFVAEIILAVLSRKQLQDDGDEDDPGGTGG